MPWGRATKRGGRPPETVPPRPPPSLPSLQLDRLVLRREFRPQRLESHRRLDAARVGLDGVVVLVRDAEDVADLAEQRLVVLDAEAVAHDEVGEDLDEGLPADELADPVE